MEINKRTILWIVFSVSLVVLWNDWMVANGKQSMFSLTPPPPAVTTPVAKAPASSVPAATTVAGAPALPGEAPAVQAFTPEIITIITDVMKVDIDTAGGVIKRLELLKFHDKLDKTKNQVLFEAKPTGIYVAQTGLISNTGAALPNHNTGFVARPGPRVINGNSEVQLVLEAEQGGVKLTKTYTFKKGDYLIGVRHDVTNLSTAPIAPSLYMQLLHHGNEPEGESWFNASYTGPTLYTDADKYQKLTFEDIEKHGLNPPLRGGPRPQDRP